MQNDFNNPVSRKKAMEKAVKEANEDQKKMMPSPDKREERKIAILISENPELARRVVHEFFGENQITYCNILPVKYRKKIVEFIDELESEYAQPR
mgnify:FL=1